MSATAASRSACSTSPACRAPCRCCHWRHDGCHWRYDGRRPRRNRSACGGQRAARHHFHCYNASYSGDPNYLSVSTQSDSECFTVTPATPVITWTSPSPITYGTPLGSAQLDAIAMTGGQTLAGTYSYGPPVGSVLRPGTTRSSV